MFHAKLIRILELTQSNEDAEALTAIRLANKLLAKNGTTWELVVGQHNPPKHETKFTYSYETQPKPQPPPPKTKPDVRYDVDSEDYEEMIAYIRVHAWPEFDMSFVESLADNYEKFGQLTYKQAKGLKNVYDTIKDNEGE